MMNNEEINRSMNDWYRDPNGGKICIDAEKAEAFLEGVEPGIKAISALSTASTVKLIVLNRMR